MLYRIMRKTYEMNIDHKNHKLKIKGPNIDEEEVTECEIDIIDPRKIEMIAGNNVYGSIFKIYIHEIEDAIRKAENKLPPISFEVFSDFDNIKDTVLVYSEDGTKENTTVCYYYNDKHEKKRFAIINNGDPIPQPYF